MNDLALIFRTVLGQIGTAFIMAMLLQSRVLKFKSLHKTVIFFPVVLSAMVVGFLWRTICNSEYGIINTVMRGPGLERYVQFWLDNPGIVIGSLMIPKAWQLIGYYLTVLLAVIRGIDQSVLGVAKLNGATGWKKSWYIVILLTRNTLTMIVMLRIPSNMKTFDQIFVMTGDGPGTSSEAVALYAYNVSMSRMWCGRGNTVVIGVLILNLLLTLISKIVGGKKEEEV